MVRPREGLRARDAVDGNANDRISSFAAAIDGTDATGSNRTGGVNSVSSCTRAKDSSAGSLADASSALAGSSATVEGSVTSPSSSLPLRSAASFLSLINSLKPEASPSPPTGETARSSSSGVDSGTSLLVGEGGEGGVVGEVALVRFMIDPPTRVAGLSGRAYRGVGGEIGIDIDDRTGRAEVGVEGESTIVSGLRGSQAESGGVRTVRGGEDGGSEKGAGGRGSWVVGANEGGTLLILLDSRFPFLPESDPDSNVNAGSYMDALA